MDDYGSITLSLSLSLSVRVEKQLAIHDANVQPSVKQLNKVRCTIYDLHLSTKQLPHHGSVWNYWLVVLIFLKSISEDPLKYKSPWSAAQWG